MAEASFGAQERVPPLRGSAFTSTNGTDREALIRSDLLAAIKASKTNFSEIAELPGEQRELLGASIRHESDVTAYLQRTLQESSAAPSAVVNPVLLGVRRSTSYSEISAAFDLRCKHREGSLVLLFDHGEVSRLDPSAPGAQDFFVVSPGSALLEVSKVATGPISYERIYLHPFEFSRQLELFLASHPETRADSLFCGAVARSLALRSTTLRLTEPFTTELIEKTPTKSVVGVATRNVNFVATFALSPNFAFTALCEAA